MTTHLQKVLGNRHQAIIITLVASLVLTISASANDGAGDAAHHWGRAFFMFAIVLLIGRLGDLVQRFGQPPVIGQLVMGMVISALGYMGISFMNDIPTEPTISFLAALGAALLLFSIGLEPNLASISYTGVSWIHRIEW